MGAWVWAIDVRGSDAIAIAGYGNDAGTTKWLLRYRDGAAMTNDYHSSGPALDTWYCMELFTTIHDTIGTYRLFIDGVEVRTQVGKDSADYGAITQVRVGVVYTEATKEHGILVDSVVTNHVYTGEDDYLFFDVDKDGEIDIDNVKIEDTKSIDDLLSEITKSEDISSDIVEDLKTIGKTATEVPEEPGAPKAPPEPKEPETAKATPEPKGPEAAKAPPEPKKPAKAPGPPKPPTKPKAPSKGEVRVVEAVVPTKEAVKEEEVEMFECPSCKTLLPVSAAVCTKCGVEFVEEEVTQFQCPECSTLVNEDINKCPSCGAVFEVTEEVVEEKEEKVVEEAQDPYKRLQEIVEEVKPLLFIAKRYDIDVTEGKDLINKAIKAGRRKDTKAALKFVKTSKDTVETSLSIQITKRIKKLEDDITETKNRGMEVDIGDKLVKSMKAVENKDYESSIQSYFEAKEIYESSCSDYVKAKDELDFITGLVENSSYLHLDISDLEDAKDALKDAIDTKNWTMASKIAAEGRKKALTLLPSQIRGEAKKARSLMIDWKSKNMDITKPIGFLKEANLALKNADYNEALKFMVLFKKETKTL